MNPHDVLKYGHLTLQSGLEGLPHDTWEAEGVCGWWSVRLIVAHLASYEQVLVEVLQSFVTAGGVERDQPVLKQLIAFGGQAFNDFQVDIRKDKPPAEMLAEYEQWHAESLALIGGVPADELRRPGTLPWYGDEYALDDFIVYQYYGHKREHTAQINVYKDRVQGK